ncbi:MAG: (Fe-S)-binding protein [Actinomycetota bacterium]|nr:(Fe-S)-binding protein [Actinomycetota bacterium]
MELSMFYDYDACQECGTCLYRCQVMNLGIEEARVEIKRLRAGDKPRYIDSRCASCFSCNVYCPNGCNPYGLILYRWYQRYLRHGLPVRAQLAMPLEEVNFNTMARKHHTLHEREMVEEWERNADSPQAVAEAGGTVLYAGCNAQILPCLLDTSLLDGLTVIGAQELCCGELYYRLGLMDVVQRQARKLEERFRRLGMRRMYVYCMAGFNNLTNVLPSCFGADFDFEIVYLGDLLMQRLEKGELNFDRPLEGTATIQDSCHAKVLGRRLQDIPRELVRRAGLEIMGMAHSREMSVCCGAACGARAYNPLHMGLQSLRQWGEARDSGVDGLVAYCATCLLLLHMGRIIRPTRMPLYHLMEVLMRASGEEPPHDLVAARAATYLPIYWPGAFHACSCRARSGCRCCIGAGRHDGPNGTGVDAGGCYLEGDIGCIEIQGFPANTIFYDATRLR